MRPWGFGIALNYGQLTKQLPLIAHLSHPSMWEPALPGLHDPQVSLKAFLFWPAPFRQQASLGPVFFLTFVKTDQSLGPTQQGDHYAPLERLVGPRALTVDAEPMRLSFQARHILTRSLT